MSGACGIEVRWRLPLLAAGGLCLLGGLYAALVRLDLPVADTLVAMERAVTLGARWALLAPACSGLGAMELLAGGLGLAGRLPLSAAGMVLLGTYAAPWRRQATVALLAQAAGALCWYAATLLWLGGFPLQQIVPWLAGFVVLTIAGLVHASLLVRVAVGDAAGLVAVWRWAGVANEAAALAFVACAVTLAVRAHRSRYASRAARAPRAAASTVGAGQ